MVDTNNDAITHFYLQYLVPFTVVPCNILRHMFSQDRHVARGLDDVRSGLREQLFVKSRLPAG